LELHDLSLFSSISPSNYHNNVLEWSMITAFSIFNSVFISLLICLHLYNFCGKGTGCKITGKEDSSTPEHTTSNAATGSMGK
jgi:hypothetical protein